jgi:hypothetical protein
MLVSVLLPTRQRPELMLKAVKSLIEKADDPSRIEVLLKIDTDDQRTYTSRCSELEQLTPNYKILISPRQRGYADLHTHVNDLCAVAEGEYLFLWNDDATMQTEHWDEYVAQHSRGDFGDPVCVIQIDNSDAWKYGFPLVHRKVYEILGHFSLNAQNDTWMHTVATHAGIERREERILSFHDRYDLTQNPSMQDSTYTDVWNPETGGYQKSHELFQSPSEQALRIEDVAKLSTYLAKAKSSDSKEIK